MNDGIYRVRVKIGKNIVTRIFAIVDGKEANWTNHDDINPSTLEVVASEEAMAVLKAIGNTKQPIDVMRVKDSSASARAWAEGATDFQKSRIR